jgi:hypothetical protein
VAGTTLPVALSVSIKDSSGRAVVGATVSWAVVAGGGSVTPTSSTTDSAGLAATQWTLGSTAGANRVTATVAGLAPVAFDATAVAGTTASVTVTSPTQSPYEGDTVQLTAIAKDAYGNVLLGKTATWKSSDAEIAPVSVSGLVQTWGTGPVDVTANIDGVQGSVSLTLTPMLVTVTVGAKELVFDWTTDRCEDLDVPDGPARFVRAEDGSLVLFDSNARRYYISRGADFTKLTRNCSLPALTSVNSPVPDSYENDEWLWAAYRVGSTWHALVHNEFHDPVASTCTQGCWYNSITYAVSTDGARTFTKPMAPAHTVAPAPMRWVPPPAGQGVAEGYFEPSNIVQAADGYYYALLKAIPNTVPAPQGLCVFRTKTLDDPASWRAWDGAGFNLRMSSPYVIGSDAPMCAFLKTSMVSSHVVYDTYLERYVLLASAVGPTMIDGRVVCGFWYALSSDLVHWSAHRLLVEASMPWCPADASRPGVLEAVNVLYPSLVDHADATINFEKAGRTPYLYYTRFNDGGLDRDLVRAPLTFTRTN